MKSVLTIFAICVSHLTFSQAQLLAFTFESFNGNGSPAFYDSIALKYDDVMQGLIYSNHYELNRNEGLFYSAGPEMEHRVNLGWDLLTPWSNEIECSSWSRYNSFQSSTVPHETCDLTYLNGRLSELCKFDAVGDTTFHEEYIYNGFGKLRTILANQNDPGNYGVYNFNYSSGGKLTDLESRRVFNQGWQVQNYVLEDSNGMLSKVFWSDSVDGQIREVHYEYDGQTMSKITNIHYANNTVQGVYTYELFRNGSGDVDSIYHTSVTSGGQADSETKFFYNSNGLISEVELYSGGLLNITISVSYLNDDFVSGVIHQNHDQFGNVTYTTERRFYYSENLGLEEENLSDFRIVPNPNNGTFKINSSKTFAKVNIFDNNGRLLMSKSGASMENEFRLDLAPGVYMLQVLNDGASQAQRLVIE